LNGILNLCNYSVPGKITRDSVKPTMLHICRVVGVEMAAGDYTEKEADNDSENFLVLFVFCSETEAYVFYPDHRVMDLLRENLNLNTKGKAKNEIDVEFRRYRRALFNPKGSWYPVLQHGESIFSNILVPK
jgi:hypothetical protein